LFSEGQYANRVERDALKAVRLLQQAVRIDSMFAQAWINLGSYMGNAGMARSAIDSVLNRGYLLRGRLPEGERTALEATYYARGPGHDRVKGIAGYERALQLGMPSSLLNEIAVAHRSRREFAAADSVYRLAIADDSNFAIAQAGLIRVLEYEGRLDAADSLIAITNRRFPASTLMRAQILGTLWNRGRFDEFQRRADSATAVRDLAAPSQPFRYAAQVAIVRGQLRKYHDLMSRSFAADSAIGQRASPLDVALGNLVVAEFVGSDLKGDLTALETALAATDLRLIPDADRPDLRVAQAVAIAGRTDRAHAVVEAYRAGIRDTTERRYREPEVQTTLGVIALSDRKPAEAIEAFRRGDMASDGPAGPCTICLPDYLAHAFDAASEPDSAIAAYETYIRTPMWNRIGMDALRLPAAHERLGQLYEAKGNTAKAVEHYRAFIELWKNADPELQPRVAGARRRLAMLTPVEKPR
jgi:tetratricopeptide (TPR) repeat protein